MIEQSSPFKSNGESSTNLWALPHPLPRLHSLELSNLPSIFAPACQISGPNARAVMSSVGNSLSTKMRSRSGKGISVN